MFHLQCLLIFCELWTFNWLNPACCMILPTHHYSKPQNTASHSMTHINILTAMLHNIYLCPIFISTLYIGTISFLSIQNIDYSTWHFITSCFFQYFSKNFLNSIFSKRFWCARYFLHSLAFTIQMRSLIWSIFVHCIMQTWTLSKVPIVFEWSSNSNFEHFFLF